MPELDYDLAGVLSAHHRMATDANGRTLASEREPVMRRFRVTDSGAVEAWHYLWDQIDAELAMIRHEELHPDD